MIDLLTVANTTYLPAALTTLKSARQATHFKNVWLFVFDAEPDAIGELREAVGRDYPWLGLFGPDDLLCWREEFLATFQYYNLMEVACLAKYVGIAHVQRLPDAADVCVYADADILFLGDIAAGVSAIGDAAALLTPHHLGPSDEALEQDCLVHGWINAGFFCIRRGHPKAGEIMEWLIARVSRRGYLAPQLGLSCDQPWLSALPFAFAECSVISSEPGLNVAYWNLRQRHLAFDDGRFSVGGKDLLFFHFSGFDPADPSRLSKHLAERLETDSPEAELCRLYRSALDEATAIGSNSLSLPHVQALTAPLALRMRRGAAITGASLPSGRRGLPQRAAAFATRIVRGA